MGVALRDILAEYKTPITWENLSGIAAVDAHNALYQFLSIIRQPDGTPLMDERGRITSHLSGILFRTLNFIEKGIKPVFVYDGEPPTFKQATIDVRREQRERAGVQWQEALERGDTEEAYRQARSASKVDRFVIESSQALLGLMGIPWVEAPSEGEAQAAYMAQRGDAQYAVSQDYDSLLFGAPVLVRNLTVSGRRKMRGRTLSITPERILLKEIIGGLGITREELIQVAILIGTDFNPGIRGIGAKTALKLVRQGEFAATLHKHEPGYDLPATITFFLSPPVTDSYSLTWKNPDPEGIRKMLCEGYNFSLERVNAALEKLGVKSGQKTLDRWF